MSRSEKNGFCVVADGRVHVELVKSNIVSCATEEIWDVQFASSIGKAHVPEALLHLHLSEDLLFIAAWAYALVRASSH